MSEQNQIDVNTSDDAAAVRRSMRAPVDISVQVFTNRMTCSGRGHELGRYGMAIHVPIDIQVGETIRIMFQPPNSKVRFGLFAVVRNRETFRYGLEFLELRKPEQAELDRVVTALFAPVAS